MPRAQLRYVAFYADPRLAMCILALHALVFGGLVAIDAVVTGPSPAGGIEAVVYDAWDTVPPVVVGSLFVAASVVLVAGVALQRPGVVRAGTLALVWLWLYAWLTLAVLAWATGGAWLPTGWARYGSPVPASWWLYLRAPGAARSWLRVRPRRTWSTLVVLVASPLAIAEALRLPVASALPTEVVTVLIAAVVSVLVGALKALADRMRARVDQSAATLGFAKEQWAWDSTHAEIKRLVADLAESRARWSEREQQWADANDYCRSNCPQFRDRPPA